MGADPDAPWVLSTAPGTRISRAYLHANVAVPAADRAIGLLEYLGIAALKDTLASNLSYGQQKLLDFGMARTKPPPSCSVAG